MLLNIDRNLDYASFTDYQISSIKLDFYLEDLHCKKLQIAIEAKTYLHIVQLLFFQTNQLCKSVIIRNSITEISMMKWLTKLELSP